MQLSTATRTGKIIFRSLHQEWKQLRIVQERKALLLLRIVNKQKKNQIKTNALRFFKKQLCFIKKRLRFCPKIRKRFTMREFLTMEWAIVKTHRKFTSKH